MASYISSCPSCRHSLEVTQFTCPHCHIEIRGHFDNHPTLNLSEEQLSFLRLFVVSRGNLREIERILGVSYPTVRNKLDDLVDAFQDAPSPKIEKDAPPPPDRRTVLEEVAAGQRTLQDALDFLNAMSDKES